MPDPVPAATRLLGSADWTEVAEESGTTFADSVPTASTGKAHPGDRPAGGCVRASTGYAVTHPRRYRTHTPPTADVWSPFAVEPDPWWQVILDRSGCRHDPGGSRIGGGIPVAVHARSGRQCRRFLDSGAGRSDVAAVIRALPPLPFLGPCRLPRCWVKPGGRVETGVGVAYSGWTTALALDIHGRSISHRCTDLQRMYLSLTRGDRTVPPVSCNNEAVNGAPNLAARPRFDPADGAVDVTGLTKTFPAHSGCR